MLYCGKCDEIRFPCKDTKYIQTERSTRCSKCWFARGKSIPLVKLRLMSDLKKYKSSLNKARKEIARREKKNERNYN